ncbi:oligosaccharide flippase family protein [Nonomuraea sediminis]|uniref:oligosaccharide flippase family protein n=1 Tax=Nonomuraea sediminis TaxID=2835864 RepID=UPI001BDD8143|nr:polysaccharide biosynthesis C-terminal domain-containing protein [Nonomuraea sediminis]
MRLMSLLAGNAAARVGAMGTLALGTVMVAQAGGAVLVGEFTLFRVLPGIVCVLAVCGLPAASPYFLARESVERQVRPALCVILLGGAAFGGIAWLALSPLLHRVFLSELSLPMVAAAAIPTFTQTFVAVGKSQLQGGQDQRGANVAIFAEEAAFLPLYGAVLLVSHDVRGMLAGLVLADVTVAAGIAVRLARTGYFRSWERPSRPLIMEICGYGLRGQVGGLLQLVNDRFDVALLAAVASPSVLGVYAVASKLADLLRMPGLALTYVLYPSFARDPEGAAKRTAGFMARAFVASAVVAVPLVLLSGPVLPRVFGAEFAAAVLPSQIMIGGTVVTSVAGLVTAYLLGIGRPGANSISIVAGVVMTVALNLLLVPRLGAVGAAIAAASANLATTATLLAFFVAVRGRKPLPAEVMT